MLKIFIREDDYYCIVKLYVLYQIGDAFSFVLFVYFKFRLVLSNFASDDYIISSLDIWTARCHVSVILFWLKLRGFFVI